MNRTYLPNEMQQEHAVAAACAQIMWQACSWMNHTLPAYRWVLGNTAHAEVGLCFEHITSRART
jgi:hypothetical protein